MKWSILWQLLLPFSNLGSLTLILRTWLKFLFVLLFLDNIGSWQVFEDDRHILNFLNSANEFTNHTIDEIQEGEEVPMIQLKSNKIPRGLGSIRRFI
jgi:hypothetical protein